MTELKDWQQKWRCTRCKDEIYSRYSGEYRSCGCGAIAVDQTTHYSRYIGNSFNFEKVEENN